MSITATIRLNTFNYWIEAARWELNQLQKYKTTEVRRNVLEAARHRMEQARVEANRAGDDARKSLCFRVLNWINADLRRLT